MRKLAIDFESFSDIDISKAGLYRYMESPAFEILLIGFAFDDEEPTVLDLTAMTEQEKESWKTQFKQWLADPEIRWTGWNCEFEINVFSTWFGERIPLDHWWDTMVTALTCGLPRSLKDVGNALGMPEDKAKLAEGKRLVTYFCTPCKPTKANGLRTRNTRLTDPEKWAKFIEYNRQDVVAERAIREKLKKYEPDESEHDAWMLSTEINRRGVMIDRQMAEMAVRITDQYNAIQIERLKQITGLENPNSNSQLASWLGIPSVAKDNVEEELKTAEGDRREVLLLRREIGKTRVAKYEAMLSSVCDDGRGRGLFAFYGANRSGRFSSKLVQLQNLPQNHLSDLDSARQMVKEDDWESIDVLYGNVPDTLSQLIRTTFVAKPGYTFAVADFSAIEARVIAYMADEQWRMDLFARGGDIYCQSASQMFGVPVVKHGINGHLRQKGKIAELGCIALNSPVLTDKGLVPIQDVTADMKVWDGNEFVGHDGVIYKGIKQVMIYEGLRATPDHLVYVEEKDEPIPLEEASRAGMHLVKVDADYNRYVCQNCFTAVYDILNAGPNHRYTVSNHLVHNCGYGGSAGALINMGALKMGLTEEELPDIVQKWREASPNIVKFWWTLGEAMIDALLYKKVSNLKHGISVWRTNKMLIMQLPSGRCLRYFDPQIGLNRFGKESVTYMGYESGKWSRLESYGPKFVENCLAQGTLVVTVRGCVPIEEIRPDDLIFDGNEWVSHDGLICNGIQNVVSVDGLKMTPDHQILTTEGWLKCSLADGKKWAIAVMGRSRQSRISVSDHGCRSLVYDIRNCGPRHQFCVCDNGQLRIVHNCIQGIARDCLVEAMKRVSKRYLDIVMHVHDEMIVEVPEAEAEEALKFISDCMAEPISWAPGMLLRGDGYITKYYKKD